MDIELCFGDADAHVPHKVVPCDVGFERWGPGERALVELVVKLGLILNGQTRKDFVYVQRIYVWILGVTLVP